MKNPYTFISVFLAVIVAGTVSVTVQAGSKSPIKASDKMADEWSAVSSAIKKGDGDAVKRLIAKGDMANLREPGPWGRSLLHVTAATSSKHPKASLEITKLLIEKGADVNARMRSGLSPLHEAARAGSDTIAKLLIASGAKLNEKVLIKNCLDPDYDMNGYTPTDAALFYKHKAVTALLRKNGGKANKLQDGQAGKQG